MSQIFDQLRSSLQNDTQKWLVTGAAGFIGSHLVENLLSLNQEVVGLDNFSNGHRHNLAEVRSRLTAEQWNRFHFQEGDITRLDDCQKACAGVHRILHQAALGSVPRSLKEPVHFHANNVSGFMNMLAAARDNNVQRFVYASSSSVYGDSPRLPKIESDKGNPLSPYAATKLIDEIYADVFHRCYKLPIIGLRYFNVFGPRQDPNGAYAAVIPMWFSMAARGDQILINGDGETSRDFCYVHNVVQANLLAATTTETRAIGLVYNVAAGRRTTLNELFTKIRSRIAKSSPHIVGREPRYMPERAGDVRHSLADINLAQTLLGYAPTHDVDQGLDEASAWYLRPERLPQKS